MKQCKNKLAFTLIELAIVISIIGLLVAATVAGISLLESAESRGLLSEVQKLRSSVANFQEVYRGLPGDISNATSYWSTSANGDGDGTIDAETSNEPFRALEQMNLAGLIEGAYAGFAGTWTIATVDGFSLSKSEKTGNVIGSAARDGAALYVKCCSTTDYSRTIDFNNHVSVFSINSTITKRSGILTPVEALAIDTKTDDGKPDTGLVGGSGSWSGSAYVSTGCYSGTGSSSAYLSADATYKAQFGCQMQFAYDWN